MQEHRSTSANALARQHTDVQWRKGEALTLPFLKFEIILYRFLWCKVVNVWPCLCTGSGCISFKRFLVAGPNCGQVWVNIYENFNVINEVR
jgi:hypothetical protein